MPRTSSSPRPHRDPITVGVRAGVLAAALVATSVALGWLAIADLVHGSLAAALIAAWTVVSVLGGIGFGVLCIERDYRHLTH